MRLLLVLIAVGVLVLIVAGVLFATERGARAAGRVELTLTGVLGDPVHLGPPRQQRPTIVYFMSRRAQEESSTLARSVDEALLNAPVEAVGIVDLRRYGGILRRLATSYVRKSATEALDHRRRRRLAKGLDASAEYVNRWHLIGDFDGALFDRFGVEREPAHPRAFVLDRDGAVHGPFGDTAGVLAAFATASRAGGGQGMASPSQAMPSK
jgi:hypothetical protein